MVVEEMERNMMKESNKTQMLLAEKIFVYVSSWQRTAEEYI